jgi:pimeloyl-ACP methyl ester carboxylesterase
MTDTVAIEGRAVTLAQTGTGAPLLYLHGFADIHSGSVGWLRFHEELARELRVIAPAHPGCAGSAEDEEIETIEDVAFHYLQLLDALALDQFHLAGSAIGGWIAAELAVRIPERVRSLSLIGATGLFVPGEPIGDLFMMVQPQRGTDYKDFRRMLFRDANAPEALAMFPDGKMDVERESLRFRMFRFASRVGFSPPYFYNRKLRGRLSRYKGPSLVIAGTHDHLVPMSHAKAYAEGLRGELRLIEGAGNSIIVEQPEETVGLIRSFVRSAAAAAA